MADQAQLHLEKFLEMYPNIPDPKHHPKVWAYYVKLYKYQVKKSS